MLHLDAHRFTTASSKFEMSSVYIFTGTTDFKFHEHIYLPVQLVNLLMEGSGLSADLACECTQTYQCIKQILDVMSIVLLLQLANQEQLNL